MCIYLPISSERPPIQEYSCNTNWSLKTIKNRIQSWISSVWIYEVLGKGGYDQDMVYKTLKKLIKVKHGNKYKQANKTPALKYIRKLWFKCKNKSWRKEETMHLCLKKQN